MFKNKKIVIICVVIILMIATSVFFLKFYNKMAKTQKIGKNSSSQEIVDYILNMNSYETTIEVEIKSNKNTNRYRIKQSYIAPDSNIQEVIEPSNIAGVKMIKKENTLTIENSNLNLVSSFQNYPYMTENCLDLNHFTENYKNNSKSCWKEENNQIIMETTNAIENKYQKDEKLFVDKNTGNPIKMEIRDTNQNTTIYILYNEVKIGSVNTENVIAFQLYNMAKEI